MRLTFHSSLAMVALMSSHVCEAIRLGSIGAVSNSPGALSDSLRNGDISRFAQVESYDEFEDEYISLGQTDKSAKSTAASQDKSAAEKMDDKVKKEEDKESKLALKEKELDLKSKELDAERESRDKKKTDEKAKKSKSKSPSPQKSKDVTHKKVDFKKKYDEER